MGVQRHFRCFSTTRSRPRVWWFVLGLAALLFSAGLYGLMTPPAGVQAHSRQISVAAHGCAPDVPPVVSDTIPAQALPGSVLINEVVSQPKSGWNCSEPSGVFSQEKDSWIEFFNPQNRALDLYAAHALLSLNGGATTMYFPFGTSIAADSFLVIFPLEKQTSPAPASWNITLSIDGTTIDQAVIPLLQPDQSYARVPDGSTTWLYAGSPAIDTTNNNLNQPPATPTPTPTKTPQATSTPEQSATPQTAQPASFGTQPAWSQIKYPLDPSPTVENTTTSTMSQEPDTQQPGPTQDTPGPQNNGPSGWSVALIVLLALILLGTIVWSWRHWRVSS